MKEKGKAPFTLLMKGEKKGQPGLGEPKKKSVPRLAGREKKA